MKIKICLGYFDKVHRETQRFIKAFEGCDIPVVFQYCTGVYIDDNRNELINKGQSTWEDQVPPEKDITHYWMIDSDISHADPVEVLKKLLSYNKDIICGAYVARANTECYTAGYFDKCIGDIDIINSMIPRKTTGLIKVDWVGAGALLIKREVFEHPLIKYPWFDRELVRFKDSEGRMHAARTGEDISFCMKATKANFDVWLDADSVFTHHLKRGSFGAMKLNVVDIEKPDFLESLTTLVKLKTLAIKDAWVLKDILKIVIEQIRKVSELKQQVFSKYPELVTNPDGVVNDSKLSSEVRTKYHIEIAELFKQEFDIPLEKPIKIAEDTQGLSAQDCINLEKIITI